MKLAKNIILTLLISLSPNILAQGENQDDDPTVKLGEYLKNLGKYFGYDLTKYCKAPGACGDGTQAQGLQGLNESTGGYGQGATSDFTNRLINEDAGLYQFSFFNSYLGALVGASSNSPVIPSSATPYSVLNTYVSKTFPDYNSPGNDTKVQVSSLMDQKTFQNDPVNQSILNILGTPSESFCMKNSSKRPPEGRQCEYLNRDIVLSQVIGEIPATEDFFSPGYIKQFLSQLNPDTLINPLMYTQEASNQGNEQTKGLQAKNQAQEAANFVRYVSGLVTPIELPSRQDYDSYFSQTASNLEGEDKKLDAKRTLNGFLTKIRTYAAQNSVGISTLYYILSKRMPQKSDNDNNPPSSQALNEFRMATWRIFNPGVSNIGDPDKQWLKQINTASAATVQKEIAVLLAEINYQMYLTRQQQERQLLVESMLLILSAKSPQSLPVILTAPTS
jgi:intracellular multiplication protein IcmX